MKRILFVAIVLLSVRMAEAVQFASLYEGLPNYEKKSPFVGKPAQLAAIVTLAQQAAISEKPCLAVTAVGPKPWTHGLRSNVCDAKSRQELERSIRNIAPSFATDSTTVWLADVDHDGKREVIVQHVEFSKLKSFEYPYLTLWLVKDGDSLKNVRDRYAGPFLEGELHANVAFGASTTTKTFVRHMSCLECGAFVYLTAIDWLNPTGSHGYEFTYSTSHDGFNPTIEYELPGSGHSAEATVETRLAPVSSSGPHLLQFFDMEEGSDEFWSFTCKAYRCDYELALTKPTEAFKSLWERSKKL